MRNLITLLSLSAVAAFVWMHRDLAAKRDGAETKLGALLDENRAVKSELQAADDRIAQLSGQKSQPSPKTNWIEEKNRNWQSKLAR